MKWQFVLKDTPKPKYICLQRRRERAGHVQGSRADGAQPASAHRRVRDRLLRDRREGRLHLHPRRVLPRAGDARGARSRRRTRPAFSARTSSAAASTATSTCIAAPARTRRARRRRSSSRSKASARSRASSRRFPAVAGLYQCPTAVNNVETLCNVPLIVLNGAGVVRAAWSGEERRPEALLHQRPREAPGRVRSVDAHDAARADLRRAVRAGHAAAAGRSRRSSRVDRRCRCCSTSTSTRRPASTHIQKAGSLLGSAGLIVLDDTRLHGVAGDEPAALLPPRVVRQVHAVPRRRRLALQAAAARRARRGADRRTSTCSSASPTTSSARRCARLATPPRRRC